MNARDRAMITAQWLTGFRISEILSLTVGWVFRNGAVVEKIGVAPKHLKGHYGRTRWVPVLPELNRALSTWLNTMARRWQLTADLPLFLSRKSEADGAPRAVDRDSARRIMHGAFAQPPLFALQRLDVACRRTWKEAFLFPIELGDAFIAHSESGTARIEPFLDHEIARSMETEAFLVLQRIPRGGVAEMVVQSG